ncbi:MAG: ATP-binding cassette domain-containing protein, partial [Dehalococcoidia bacterium]|nr:ATP-binding cassette domain-containing protein [Dehalococcoidia bacterium]
MLRVSNLEVYYGNMQVLERVSLYVNQGELVTLIGSNGAGKTAFLMTLCGIIRPRSGTIEWQGMRIDKLSSHAIVGLGIALVPQGRMLFPDMTVSENLELGAYQATDVKSKGIKHKMEEIYNYFEVLKERKSQKAGTLSGGEQQMLAIGL